MQYQKDVRRYHKMVRRRQAFQKAKGSMLIMVALAMLLYAIPCFATSIWDETSSSRSNATSFSTEISENDYVGNIAASSEADKVSSTSDYLVSDTMGPGLLQDEEAVKSAKLRAQAVLVAEAERNARMIEANGVYVAPVEKQATQDADLTLAYIATCISLICAISGIKTFMKARKIRGKIAYARYDSALRAF